VANAFPSLRKSLTCWLVYLVHHRDRVVTKDDLVASMWGGRIGSDSALTTAINTARQAVATRVHVAHGAAVGPLPSRVAIAPAILRHAPLGTHATSSQARRQLCPVPPREAMRDNVSRAFHEHARKCVRINTLLERNTDRSADGEQNVIPIASVAVAVAAPHVGSIVRQYAWEQRVQLLAHLLDRAASNPSGQQTVGQSSHQFTRSATTDAGAAAG